MEEADRTLAAQWPSDDLTGLRVGIPNEYFVDPMTKDATDIWRAGIRHMKERGATIVPVSLPHTKYALPAYFTLALAEAGSNLARYDGVRYG